MQQPDKTSKLFETDTWSNTIITNIIDSGMI